MKGERVVVLSQQQDEETKSLKRVVVLSQQQDDDTEMLNRRRAGFGV